MNPQTTIVKPGMHLFHENDRSRELYIIQSGKVKVYRTLNGREVELAMIGKGSVLGEMALIDGRPRSASAVALDMCVVVVVDAESFHARVTGVPAWLMTIVKMTSRKIRNADRLLQSIGAGHHGINIILALYYQFSRWGETLDIVLVRQFLVRLLRVTDEQIVRVIEFLAWHKFVACEEDNLRLVDRAGFSRYGDFLRLYLKKTYEHSIVPSAKVREFVQTVAREMPETAAPDGMRPPLVELRIDKADMMLDKSSLKESKDEVLADCSELLLCTIVFADKKEQSAEPPSAVSLQINTALWRQWYLYFLYNGAIPCM